jgi:DNA repair protein RecN (Recombination protein N)
LAELRIVNFALIDELVVQFESGFQVLTGETGAGKSIIVDAIALLVGGRASVDQIRTDAEEAVIEGVFVLAADHAVTGRLAEEGLLGAGEHELVIRRVLSRSGRHRLYLNGHVTPLQSVQRLAGTLIDIHGQHEQQSLLSPAAQLSAIDTFGDLGELHAAYAEAYARWRRHETEWHEAERQARARAEREDLIRFQYDELHQARLRLGEEEELTAERERLAHSRRLAELANDVYESLYAGDRALTAELGSAAARLAEMCAIDTSARDWISFAETAAAQLKELAHQLRAYREALVDDPDRLAAVEDRLNLLHRLRKKYGGTEAQLLARAEELARDVEQLEQGGAGLAEWERRVAEDRAAVQRLAERLSAARRAAAVKLERRVVSELKDLRMEGTRFQVAVETAAETPAPSGCDRVDYRLSANPGEPLQPLDRVASGGELSRIMLALKTVLADRDRVPILVFDEVDAGIGGEVATVMGRRLQELGRYHQLFCITHLPQVASQAETHFHVSKTVVKKRTVVRVVPLDRSGRLDEVARMLAGLSVSDAARQTAADLLARAPGSPTPARSRR